MLTKIIVSVLVPLCVTFAFVLMAKSAARHTAKMTDDKFTVMLPRTVLGIGVVEVAMCGILILCFTLFSEEIPHPLFYIMFGLLAGLGAYLILKTVGFKVVVEGDNITVFSPLRKPYTFTFDEIVSVLRQTKPNRMREEGSERMVIRTAAGRKLIVENVEISYKRFRKKIREKVPSQRLKGFPYVSDR